MTTTPKIQHSGLDIPGVLAALEEVSNKNWPFFAGMGRRTHGSHELEQLIMRVTQTVVAVAKDAQASKSQVFDPTKEVFDNGRFKGNVTSDSRIVNIELSLPLVSELIQRLAQEKLKNNEMARSDDTFKVYDDALRALYERVHSFPEIEEGR